MRFAEVCVDLLQRESDGLLQTLELLGQGERTTWHHALTRHRRGSDWGLWLQ